MGVAQAAPWTWRVLRLRRLHQGRLHQGGTPCRPPHACRGRTPLAPDGAWVRAVMFLLNVYQGKVDPGFVPSLLPHMLGAVTLPGAAPIRRPRVALAGPTIPDRLRRAPCAACLRGLTCSRRCQGWRGACSAAGHAAGARSVCVPPPCRTGCHALCTPQQPPAPAQLQQRSPARTHLRRRSQACALARSQPRRGPGGSCMHLPCRGGPMQVLQGPWLLHTPAQQPLGGLGERRAQKLLASCLEAASAGAGLLRCAQPLPTRAFWYSPCTLASTRARAAAACTCRLKRGRCAEPDVASLSPRLQALHTDLKMAQVKTISFLAYLLRINTSLLAPHKARPRARAGLGPAAARGPILKPWTLHPRMPSSVVLPGDHCLARSVLPCGLIVAAQPAPGLAFSFQLSAFSFQLSDFRFQISGLEFEQFRGEFRV